MAAAGERVRAEMELGKARGDKIFVWLILLSISRSFAREEAHGYLFLRHQVSFAASIQASHLHILLIKRRTKFGRHVPLLLPSCSTYPFRHFFYLYMDPVTLGYKFLTSIKVFVVVCTYPPVEVKCTNLNIGSPCNFTLLKVNPKKVKF